MNSIARNFDVNKGVGKLIDVKQRAIIVVKRKDANATVVCAEPSPDALSAYAMQLALEGSTPSQGELKLAASSQESAAYIGLRTQSIQLLRDAMYRNCEAYANGAIDEAQYGIASRRYQRSMVALLAIEQLTGAIRVPPITITTEGAVEVAKSMNQMQAEADALDEEIVQLTQDINDINTTGKTGNDLKALKEKKAKLENQKSSREKNRKAIEEGIANARGVITRGKTYATVHGNGAISRNDQHIQNVSDAVVEIFKDINEADDFTQLCGSYLIAGNKTDKNTDRNNTMTKICVKRLEQMIDESNTSIRNEEKSVDALIEIILDESRSEDIRKIAMEKLYPSADKMNNESMKISKKIKMQMKMDKQKIIKIPIMKMQNPE